MDIDDPSYSVVVVAAGIGHRMQGHIPKQYLPIGNRTLLEWAVTPFLSHPKIQRIVLVLSANDDWFSGLILAQHPKIITATGAQERYGSVLSGLEALSGFVGSTDWVMVHDAARPNLAVSDVDRLIDTVGDDPVGGILGAPVSDSLKSVGSDQRISADISREALWRAFTPQLFRYELLLNSLRGAVSAGQVVTDEASAVKQYGHQPIIVLGRTDNIKVTTPDDYEMLKRLMVTKEVTV